MATLKIEHELEILLALNFSFSQITLSVTLAAVRRCSLATFPGWVARTSSWALPTWSSVLCVLSCPL